MKTLEVQTAKYEPTESELLSDHRVATEFGARGTKWAHPKSVDKWLRKMAIGTTLNVCCGDSLVGEVRVDIDPTAKGRTEHGDAFNLRFEPQSFDTVICDPPFSFYTRFRWILALADIARKRLIISAPVQVRLKKAVWDRRLFALVGDGVFIRLYWVFDRKVRPFER